MNYDAASRLTTSTAGGVTTTYTFDSNGNLTGVNEAGTLITMVYDKENRLKEHKQGAAANTRTFAYDLNSLKQSETVSKVTNQLVWDGADMLGEVPAVKPVGAPLMPTRYNLAQGILFATTRFEPAATRTDTGADFIGSILIDFDENGDFVAERRYKPYGELLAGTATTYGWTGNTGSRATLSQYAEQYNRRRHYSTKLKQWTTRDPLWPDESAYGYVRGGPLAWADPSGKGIDIGFGRWPRWTWPDFRWPKITTGGMSISEIISAGATIGTRLIPVIGIGLCPVSSRLDFVKEEIKLPKGGPRPDEANCNELWERYKSTCNKVRSSKCDWLSIAPAVLCALARLRFTVNCERVRGNAKAPNPCEHARIVCNLLSFAKKCQDRELPAWEGQNVVEYGFDTMCKWCRRTHSVCGTVLDREGNPLPWNDPC